LSLFVYFGW